MRKSRTIRVILRDQAKEEYIKLSKLVKDQKEKGRPNSEEMQLLKSIDKKIGVLKYNPAYGQSIPKKLIPRTLDVDNLFRVELTHYWRMLYIIDHVTYDKLLGYRGR